MPTPAGVKTWRAIFIQIAVPSGRPQMDEWK